jgi:3-oxoacyl-[acyl-carrier protein] reductase
MLPLASGLLFFMYSFSSQVILISGGSRGIGAATAVAFARAGGAAVAINYLRNLDSAERVARAVERAGARALLLKGDVSIAQEARSLVDQTLETFGRLDTVVANAGVWPAEDRATVDLDDNQFEATIRTNVHGVFWLCRRAAEHFIRAGRGNIVTVSSTAGQRGEAFHSDYAASKGAVISFTKSLATELGPAGIRVNCVAPGWVDTDMSASALHAEPGKLERVSDAIPLRRIASAEDVVGPILFLASDLARHITGEVINVNGGAVLCG